MTTSTSAPTMTEAAVREISQRHDEPEWLLERRLAALRAFEAMAMPDPRAEEWRRTDISGFDWDEAMAQSVPENVRPQWGGSLDGNGALVVVSGSGRPYWEQAGEVDPRVYVRDLHQAALDHEDLVREHLHSLARPTDWKLAALQAAAWEGGAFVYVPAGVEVTLPVRYVLDHAGQPSYPHLLIVAESNSDVTVVQESSGEAPSGHSLVNGAVEIVCKPDARVKYVDVQDLGSGGVYAFSTIRARLERGAQLAASLVGIGGLLSKTKLEVSLEGEGAHAELMGVTYGDGKQHFDYMTLQDHISPRTSSDLLFKAALDGESSTVWTGTVHIQKTAGLSEAHQTSRNLLLSDHARAAPIPVLEIEAYDVLQCSHGASAGPLDEDQRFYLQSRGIPSDVAQQLLVEAFFVEVIDRLPAAVDHEAIKNAVLTKLGGGA
jgi:Fe-S cluster assembly protein SufD